MYYAKVCKRWSGNARGWLLDLYNIVTTISEVEEVSIFSLQIGSYELNNLKVVEIEIEEIILLIFSEVIFNRYDPRSTWEEHCEKLRYT